MFTTLYEFFFTPKPAPLPANYEFPSMVEHLQQKVTRLQSELAGLRMLSSNGTPCPSMIAHYEQKLAIAKRDLVEVSAMRK